MTYSFSQFNGVGELYRFLNSLKRKGQYLSVDPSSELAETLGIESFEISKDGDYVCIDRIKVKEPKHGDGTRLMELVCKWADENGTITEDNKPIQK